MLLCNCIPFANRITHLPDSGEDAPSAPIPHKFDTYTILNESDDSDHQIIKEGYLYKTSKFLNQSRKRWIMLHGIKLYSFKDREYYYPTETLDLTEYDTISISDSDPDPDSDSKPAFELVSSLSMKSRVFIAADLGEMYEWMQFIAAIQVQHIQLSVTIKHTHSMSLFADTIPLYISYHDSLSLSDIIQYSMKQMESKLASPTLWATHITSDSFTGAIDADPDTGYINPNEATLNTSITKWDSTDIHSKGLYLYVNQIYIHRTSSSPDDHDKITCKHMLQWNSKDHKTDCKHRFDPMQCPIYHGMMRAHNHTEEDYNHLNECNHFRDSFVEKPHCIFYRNCVSYKRLKRNGGPYTISDMCHMKLYKHPARSQRAMDNQKNIKKLFINCNVIRNLFVYPLKECKPSNSNCNVLIDEIMHNGFENDLHSIWDVIYDKYESHRHHAMGQPLQLIHLLALVMYTSGECRYDLSRSQRKGDYKKWGVLDYYLFEAIYKLNACEIGTSKLYLGVDYNKLNTKCIRNCHFVTYVSASCLKEVAMSFVSDEGMCIKIPLNTRHNIVCADLSWITNFPDEHQVLIARSTNVSPQCLDATVLTHQKDNGARAGPQVIELKNRFQTTQQIWQYFMNKQLEYLTHSVVVYDDSIELKEHEPYSELIVLRKKLMSHKKKVHTHHVHIL